MEFQKLIIVVNMKTLWIFWNSYYRGYQIFCMVASSIKKDDRYTNLCTLHMWILIRTLVAELHEQVTKFQF